MLRCKMRRGLTEVPEQVSFQELSTVLCAGARNGGKPSAHPKTIHQGLEEDKDRGVSLRQIQDIPDFSNAVIVDCVFSSACLLPAFSWVPCLQHQPLVPASWLHFLQTSSLLLPRSLLQSDSTDPHSMEERQIRDCLLPAASNQQNLNRVRPAQPNQSHAMQIGTTGFGNDKQRKKMTLLLNRPDFECHFDLW